MAATCSHSDQSRSTVSATAHGVAFIRSLESFVNKTSPLFDDPYAGTLGGEIGKDWLVSTTPKIEEGHQSSDFFSHVQHNPWLNIVILRTRKIDDLILQALERDPEIRQVCVLGAGLDTRVWRLKLPEEGSRQLRYFEVDFPEIFDYKLTILKHQMPTNSIEYRPVKADLSLPQWHQHLRSCGHMPTEPTLWLLEGLTGYLSEEELANLFQDINNLSGPKSQVIATFLTPSLASVKLALHRFLPPDPLAFMQSLGWNGVSYDMEDVAKEYNRLPIDQSDNNLEMKILRGYHLLQVSLIHEEMV